MTLRTALFSRLVSAGLQPNEINLVVRNVELQADRDIDAEFSPSSDLEWVDSILKDFGIASGTTPEVGTALYRHVNAARKTYLGMLQDLKVTSLGSNGDLLSQTVESPGLDGSLVEIAIDPGSASAEDIQDLLGLISDLHVAHGGDGLIFEINGLLESHAGVPR